MVQSRGRYNHSFDTQKQRHSHVSQPVHNRPFSFGLGRPVTSAFDPTVFKDQAVQVSGFCFFTIPGFPKISSLSSRFVITCCVADASALGYCSWIGMAQTSFLRMVGYKLMASIFIAKIDKPDIARDHCPVGPPEYPHRANLIYSLRLYETPEAYLTKSPVQPRPDQFTDRVCGRPWRHGRRPDPKHFSPKTAAWSAPRRPDWDYLQASYAGGFV